jgi:alcohol dehydrogenase class IV
VLPHVMTVNLAALRARAPGSPALPRYDEVGRLLTGRPEATATDGVQWVQELCAELRIPKLRELGLGEQDIVRVVPHAARSSSMKGNPIELEPSELETILRRAW